MNSPLIDHIIITAPSLEAGADLVKKSLGVAPQKGGEHPRMGTHNLLLRLGDAVFLEVISCHPGAVRPNRPRWFALDEIKEGSLPQLTTWVVRTDDIQSSVGNSSESLGNIEQMSRGNLDWLITIPEDGRLPVSGGAPALIQWYTEEHPAANLEDFGLSLEMLQISHPEPERLTKLLNSLQLKDKVEILNGDETEFIAHINSPKGVREISSPLF